MNIADKLAQYKQSHDRLPEYINADIVWLDTGEIASNVFIKLSNDVEEDTDHLIFFYVKGIEDLQSLCTPGCQDFIILEDSVEFLENL